MSWKNQLRKAPFGPFKRKKPQTQTSESPEEAKKKKEQDLIVNALTTVQDALTNDTSMSMEREMQQTQLLYEKIDKFHDEGHMGSTGIEGAKRFLNYLANSGSTFQPVITDAARKALSQLENEEGLA